MTKALPSSYDTACSENLNCLHTLFVARYDTEPIGLKLAGLFWQCCRVDLSLVATRFLPGLRGALATR
jgi:hypothetical protein